MTDHQGFEEWLNGLLSKPLPSGIAAFNFNLYENSDEQEAGFAVQVTSTMKIPTGRVARSIQAKRICFSSVRIIGKTLWICALLG